MKGRMKFGIVGIALAFVFLMGITILPGTSSAAPPVVKTVPWVATNPLIPHDTYSGKVIRLKGTSDVQGANIQYTWDFGDGSSVATGTVTNKYVIEASHTYAGPVGTIWTARLTVQNTGTGETGSKEYYVAIQNKTLQVEVNVAIDEGLWYLHKTQSRSSSGGIDYGNWQTCPSSPCYATDADYASTPANLNAFFVNGHLETGSADNPYTETVQRGMKRLFELLITETISNQTYPAPIGTVNPDSNGNGYGVRVNQGNYPYQGGMFMDAIVASGTPNAVTTTGPVPSGANPGIRGRTYKSIVQDMVDSYAYGQYNSGSNRGAWRYTWNQGPDNTASQWGAIGILAAERVWGCIVPSWLKDENLVWLTYSQNSTTGTFGYTATSATWGFLAITPSGMVQMAMDGKGRGYAGPPSWDKAETYVRDHFCAGSGPTVNIKDYYYGLFSFVKSMLLHDSNGDGIAEPIQLLQSSTPGNTPIDWYSAQAPPNGTDSCDGVARTLVGDQNAGGYWSGHNYDSRQYPYETAWAIIMLNRTVFASGLPVAVATAVPNPGIVGQVINFNGGTSFHQDGSKNIVMWEWDLDNNGTFETPGVVASRTFPALGNYPVNLRVTDNSIPPKTATTTIIVQITTPPIAPTADAGGPYNFCTNRTPWFLNGTGSVNPDEGQHQPGAYPGDTIIAYEWELDGLDNDFNEAFGPTPDVTAFFTAKGVGSYLIQLRVTDNTAASFPSSGMGNLSDTDSAQVNVKAATDPACSCVSDLTARPKLNKAELRWTPRAGAVGYNVYRGTSNGGPYSLIGQVNGAVGFYLDSGPLSKITYYYIIRERALNGSELCQSNQATCIVTGR